MAAKTADDLTDAQNEMNEIFAEFEADFRADDDGHTTVEFEDDDVVIVADHVGHEINEFAAESGVDREALSRMLHDRAEKKMGETDAHAVFGHADPLVFEKSDD